MFLRAALRGRFHVSFGIAHVRVWVTDSSRGTRQLIALPYVIRITAALDPFFLTLTLY